MMHKWWQKVAVVFNSYFLSGYKYGYKYFLLLQKISYCTKNIYNQMFVY